VLQYTPATIITWRYRFLVLIELVSFFDEIVDLGCGQESFLGIVSMTWRWKKGRTMQNST
jgi:hypothetical protein